MTFSGRIIINGIDGNEVPNDYYFYFGGMSSTRGILFPFPGLLTMSVGAKNASSAVFGIRVEPFNNIFIKGLAGYLKTADNFKDIFNLDGSLFGWGIEVGIRTPFGPVRASITFCDKVRKDPLLQLEAGYSF